MTQRQATIFGFFLASLIPPLELAAYAGVSEFQKGLATLPDALLLCGVSFLMFYPYSAFFTALLGVPIFLVFQRLGAVNWTTAALGGAFAGAVVAAFVRTASEPFAIELARFVPISAISALIFLWVRNRARGPGVSVP